MMKEADAHIDVWPRSTVFYFLEFLEIVQHVVPEAFVVAWHQKDPVTC